MCWVFRVLRLASLALLGVGVAQALAQSIASANYSCRAAHSGGACMPVRPWILHTMFRHDTFVAVGGSRHPGRGRSDPGFASCVLHPLACFAVSSAVQEQGQRASPEDGPQVLQLFDGRLWRLTGCCALQHELEHLACPVRVRLHQRGEQLKRAASLARVGGFWASPASARGECGRPAAT